MKRKTIDRIHISEKSPVIQIMKDHRKKQAIDALIGDEEETGNKKSRGIETGRRISTQVLRTIYILFL